MVVVEIECMMMPLLDDAGVCACVRVKLEKIKDASYLKIGAYDRFEG